ncbi:hypothetical protein [Paenibacillus sp. FSL P2-0173]|uniref:hypothetical protein n=1 Tax=Paenibacillus sp. FSL P2-0173 TaxID=2921627 RepID=UPI0030F81190
MTKKHILWTLAGVLLVWALSGYFISMWFGKPDGGGTFGDMFGAINALFSGLAFAGLIYTITVQKEELIEQRKAIKMQTNELELQVTAINMQTEELALQRQAIETQTAELKMQREETTRSADQLEMQRQLMNYQVVLTTVNDLIKLKNSTIATLDMTIERNTKKGVEAIKAIAQQSHQRSRSLIEQDHLKQLKQYEKSCTFMLQFVIDSDLAEFQTKNLKKIIKVNISNDEAVVLRRLSVDEGNQHNLMLFNNFDL